MERIDPQLSRIHERTLRRLCIPQARSLDLYGLSQSIVSSAKDERP